MEELISICGIMCSECPAYIATRDDDNDLRKKTAADWSKQFKADIKPEDIHCVGCITKDGVHFSHCSECEIRACGMKQEVVNCAHCSDYPCEILEGFFKMVPDAKVTLDGVRATLG